MEIKIYANDVPDSLRDELDSMYVKYILNDDAYSWINDWEEPDQIYIAYEGAAWLGVTELFYRTILVGEREIPVAGISGVLTHPDHRGRGIAPLLIETALTDARKVWSMPFGLLTCKPALVPYYERLGWMHIDTSISFRQGEQLVTFDPQKVRGMIYNFDEKPFPQGAINLQVLPW